MILLDANLLIYAVNSDALLHARAKQWLASVLSSTETVGLSSQALLAFLRLTTRQGLFARPLAIADAFDVIGEWLGLPNVVLLEAGPRHWHIMRSLLIPAGVGGNLVGDAHLAALAIEHGCVLCSADRDFERFPGLKFRNPIAG